MRRARLRPWRSVPWPLYAALALALAAQLALGVARGGPTARARALPAPPTLASLRVLALGEPAVLARGLMLWLQGFDYQPGLSLAFRQLDYGRLEAWLDRALALDPDSPYPLLAAARLYGEVADPARQRRMIAFVRRHYAAAPERRWPWLAHAVYLAKHRLHDLELALTLARDLARLPDTPAIPSWVRQMHIFVLEDLGEVESAKILLGGLLASGAVRDPHERWFLGQRLAELEAATQASRAPDTPSE